MSRDPVFSLSARSNLGTHLQFPNSDKTYRAKFDFHAQQPNDLGFEKGQIITALKISSSTHDWWLGCIGDKKGIFPGMQKAILLQNGPCCSNVQQDLIQSRVANYVEIDTKLDNQSHLNGRVFVQKYIALFSFKGEQPGDLSFPKGTIVEVTKKTDSPFGWWVGRVGERKGIFPGKSRQSPFKSGLAVVLYFRTDLKSKVITLRYIEYLLITLLRWIKHIAYIRLQESSTLTS